MKIGIPRALIYWKRPYFWEAFFDSLGFDVLLSPPTNKEIIREGTRGADPETCFSNKVYWGHLMWLDQKCDFIFVPRLKTNKRKLEYCPRLFGLPDLAKLSVKTPILTQTFDERREPFKRTLERMGRQLKKGRPEINRAFKAALAKEKTEKEKEKKRYLQKISSEKPKIVLVSHPYNLYDSYVNLRTEEKLEKLGVEPIFIDEVFVEDVDEEKKPFGINFHWESAREIFEKIEEVFKYDIMGGIEISSFQCGCDGVIKEFVEKRFKTEGIPFLYLIIDEHTGEAGLQTRLEAFIDTLRMRSN